MTHGRVVIRLQHSALGLDVPSIERNDRNESLKCITCKGRPRVVPSLHIT